MSGFVPVLRKEALHMIRDRGTLRVALFIPVFQLVLFGLIDTNVRDVPTAVFDQSRTQASRQLVRDFVKKKNKLVKQGQSYVARIPAKKK